MIYVGPRGWEGESEHILARGRLILLLACSTSHGPSPAGPLISITLPVDLAQLHTAVIAAFDQDAPSTKRGNDKVYPTRENLKQAHEVMADGVDVDEWDLV